MKANELMIGDWIEGPNEGEMGQVFHISDDEYCEVETHDREPEWYESGYYFGIVERFVPISLTKEMLFANGFNKYVSCRGKTYYGYTTDHKILFEIMEWVEGTLETAVGGRYIELKYVHELQHLLRLAGLDKVADEFKVKIDQPIQSQ